MGETPEQTARREIDANLVAAGCHVQDRRDLDLTTSDHSVRLILIYCLNTIRAT